jgi:cyclic beta-1,2-glucan synthetase
MASFLENLISYFIKGDKSRDELLFQNSFGGFNKKTGEYVINHGGEIITPRPWANVIANRTFGTITTESSLGMTWFDNSKEKRISSWSNDTVMDTPAEVIYIKDNKTAKFWTTTRLPVGNSREDGISYKTVHGNGYTIFETEAEEIENILTVFVDPVDQIKVLKQSLKNKSNKKRSLSLYYYVDTVMGNYKNSFDNFLTIKFDGQNNCVKIKREDKDNPKTVFVSTDKPVSSWSNNRKCFVGYTGSLRNPHGIRDNNLSDTGSYPKDNCCVIKVDIEIQPKGNEEAVFILGAGLDDDHISNLISKYIKKGEADLCLKRVKEYWDHINSGVIIKTPDRSLNILFDKWLLYQTLSCRIFGRSSFYQSSGAYGFRDQLQDVMAMLYVDKNICKNQILLAASRQFEEGDVQHWWFEDTSMGVRNMVADSPLWLPFVVNFYIEKTNDDHILDEVVPYLKGSQLTEDITALVEVPLISGLSESIWTHCLKAIYKVADYGIHGIPLMKEGDWNDGMNMIGEKGKGESIWIGWFLCDVLDSYIELADIRGDLESKSKLKALYEDLKLSMHDFAWDGEWYLRAYTDEEIKLGSNKGDVCKIDSISQSWAVISNADVKERQGICIDSVLKHLVDEENELGMLFTPPFDGEGINPGYIKDYVPGIRENGGQYSHALFWLIMALCMQGRNTDAYKLLGYTNPVKRTETEEKLLTYELEPYIVGGDIYSNKQHMAKGGWSWYSASSGLMYRTVLEYILGFELLGNKIRFKPCIPNNWDEFSIKYKYNNSTYNIKVELKKGHINKVEKIYVDKSEIESDIIDLVDDGKTHKVLVKIS